VRDEAKIEDLWQRVRASSRAANRLALGRSFHALRALYSERSPERQADNRRTSGHGTFERECVARGHKPRTVRDLIADYEASLNGGQSETSADKRRRARRSAKIRAGTRALSSLSELDRAILDFVRSIPYSAVQSAYRSAAKELHPDRGGNCEQMTELNRLWEILEAGLK